MAKNRVIYQSQAVYAGPDKTTNTDAGWIAETGTSPDNRPKQLKRVQSANYGFDIARTDVNQFGELAAIDRIVLESPTVNFDSSWYLCNFYNEDLLGLVINDSPTAKGDLTGVLGDILSNYAGERNYYVRVVKEGSDAVGYDSTAEAATNSDVIGIGNGFLASWSAEAAVGGFPTANVTIEGLNIAFTTKHTGWAPHVSASDGTKNSTKAFTLPDALSEGGSSSSIKAIKPGDVTMTLPTSLGGAKLDGIAVQSFNCSVDLTREPLQKLGSRFAFAREITFPVTASLSVDCLVGDMSTGNLSDIIDTNDDQEIIVTLDPDASTDKMNIVMKKAKLDSQSFTQGIGDNQTVSLNWSAQVGSATQSGIGLFLSGAKA